MINVLFRKWYEMRIEQKYQKRPNRSGDHLEQSFIILHSREDKRYSNFKRWRDEINQGNNQWISPWIPQKLLNRPAKDKERSFKNLNWFQQEPSQIVWESRKLPEEFHVICSFKT